VIITVEGRDGVIRIYGKEKCGLCEAAKKKLDILGLSYEFRLVGDLDNWRQDVEHLDAMVEYQLIDTLPVIAIDGRCMSYPAAMRELKERK